MGNLLALDESIFDEDFGVRPFRIRHRLAGHPFLSLDRLLERISLEHIESDPELGWLVDASLEDVAVQSERIDPGMRARHGSLFVSPAGAVVPSWAHPEHAFLLQVRGRTGVAAFVLRPGDGLYVPGGHPYALENGPELSITLRIAFRTESTDARESGFAHDSPAFEPV